jgi:hypothetical protein
MAANTTSFVVDATSRKALDTLRGTINATSNAEVLRRALALLVLASETTTKGGQIVLRDKSGKEREVVLT